MNIKCEHCGHEGDHTTFAYMYNTRLQDPSPYRECPKCFGWNLVDQTTGEIKNFDKMVLETYKIHSDQGVGVHAKH